MILDQHVSAPPTPKKIWDSIVLWNFQQQFLKKERKLMTVLSCPKCGILKQGVPEDLDEFAEEILEISKRKWVTTSSCFVRMCIYMIFATRKNIPSAVSTTPISRVSKVTRRIGQEKKELK